jgi:hypothetical protein
MTEKELELLQSKARAIALQVLLDWQTNQLNLFLSILQEDARTQTVKSLQNTLSEMANHFEMLPFRNFDPAEADMLSAEFHAQMSSAVDDIKKKIGQPYRLKS